mgnify:CR=1 FL=1|jgi:hypothetical protein
MSSSVFLRLVQRGRIGDPLAALVRGKGIDDQMSGADQPRFHRRRRLNRQELIHERLVEAPPKLTQRFGQHEVRLVARGLILLEPTGIHHRKVGP